MTELLIIKPSSLGDIVHGLQVAASIKAQQPDVRISWIVRDIFAPIVKACEAVDHTYVFQRKGGVGGFFKMMREVRETKFDYVFDMQCLLRTGLMTYRTIATKKVGRADSREGASLFYDEQVPLPENGKNSHALDILLKFCPVLGLKPELKGALRFRDVEGINLNHVVSANGARPILMFPDSRRPEKCWPGFKELTELIARDGTGRKVVWAGNNYVNFKDAPPESQFLNLTGNTSLVALPTLIRKSAWVVSNDSGPMHLAASLGVPTLGIFGPTDPRLYGPYPLTSPTNHVVQAPLGNLKLLTPKEVYARFQRLDGFRVRTAAPFEPRGF